MTATPIPASTAARTSIDDAAEKTVVNSTPASWRMRWVKLL